MFWESQVTRLR